MRNPLFSIETDAERKPMLKTFGKNIQRLRKSKGLTQEELGERANVNYKFISEIERGLKNPSCMVIYKICRALGISPAEILMHNDCSDIDGNPIKKVKRLFSGREKKEVQKAIRILEVLFQ